MTQRRINSAYSPRDSHDEQIINFLGVKCVCISTSVAPDDKKQKKKSQKLKKKTGDFFVILMD